MAFTDSFPISGTGTTAAGGGNNTQCGTQAAKMLTDNSDVGFIRFGSEGDGSTNVNVCYAPNYLVFTRFTAITIPSGATITGVRFTVDARAVLTDLSDGLEYQVSVNGGTAFTTAAALDLTGANGIRGATSEFHTTSATDELHGLTWSTTDSDYDGTDVQWRLTLGSGEAAGNTLEIEFVKLRVYYDEAVLAQRPTYSNSADEQVFSNGIVNVENGFLKF